MNVFQAHLPHSPFPVFYLQVLYFTFDQNFASPPKQYSGIKCTLIQSSTHYPYQLTRFSLTYIVSGAWDRGTHTSLETDSLLYHKQLLFTQVLW